MRRAGDQAIHQAPDRQESVATGAAEAGGHLLATEQVVQRGLRQGLAGVRHSRRVRAALEFQSPLVLHAEAGRTASQLQGTLWDAGWPALLEQQRGLPGTGRQPSEYVLLQRQFTKH